ncbi:MAG: hypothetical protein A2113_02410 [Candidatus Woykebacteria bacterium GWA1_44_8]|uniref:RCK N-terminal domain-containing protein n=1 Tax=Candidatus Woykebacteria bacterium GWA1_44_8 TaxID=1802591 RepID=A0A1G1W387_9BACT|nr:MAG: hypothetical protein A2113_02410 [Candidatus Woykebacteria bacterium GWA1_44_8]
MSSIFTDTAIILALVSLFAAIFSRLRQPLLLSYILVGVLVASAGLVKEVNRPTLDFFAELGIAFALFLIGLELRFSEIRQISRAALWVGLGQVVFTTFFGFLIARGLGFSNTESFYLGLATSFSSTLIVVKLLCEKRDLDSLYGKIATGYLIIQDFVAIAVLLMMAAFTGGRGGLDTALTLGGGVFLVALILVLNRYVLQNFFDLLAKNTEVLFLASVSWALVFAAIFFKLGFSLEIGAFLAGLGLATLREEPQIAAWVRPLRDLFIIIFFLSLGLHLPAASLFSQAGTIVLLSLFVLIGHPLIMMIIMGSLGFRRRTSFHVAMTSAQVSEFSLILVFLGARLKILSAEVVNVTTAVALITIVLSTYLFKYSSRIYRYFSSPLKIFERKSLAEAVTRKEDTFANHVVLVGAGRLGWNIRQTLLKRDYQVVVVDFNPEVVKALEAEQAPVIYGDISDPEIFEKACVGSAKMVISTVFDHEDTRSILSEIKNLSRKVPVVVTSAESSGALEFYREGASYVIVPRILSSHLIEKFLTGEKMEELLDGSLRKEHIDELANRKVD